MTECLGETRAQAEKESGDEANRSLVKSIQLPLLTNDHKAFCLATVNFVSMCVRAYETGENTQIDVVLYGP